MVNPTFKSRIYSTVLGIQYRFVLDTLGNVWLSSEDPAITLDVLILERNEEGFHVSDHAENFPVDITRQCVNWSKRLKVNIYQPDIDKLIKLEETQKYAGHRWKIHNGKLIRVKAIRNLADHDLSKVTVNTPGNQETRLNAKQRKSLRQSKIRQDKLSELEIKTPRSLVGTKRIDPKSSPRKLSDDQQNRPSRTRTLEDHLSLKRKIWDNPDLQHR